MNSTNQESRSPASNNAKLSVGAHVVSGWPLLLVPIGGAIGGGLGGAAYAINISIYRSKLSAPAKVALNIGVGLAAIGIWLLAAIAIQVSQT